MSLLLSRGSCFDHIEELVKQIPVVERARTRLRMKLDGQDRQRFVREALDRAVVEVDQGDVPARTARQRPILDDIPVILRRDRHMVAASVEDRMITAPVPEFELDR